MNRFGCRLLFGLGFVLFAIPCFADALAPPVDLPPNAAAFNYIAKTDETKDVTFVRMTKEDLGRLVAAAKGQQASWTPPATRSIVAALAASVGLASVFLLRSNRHTKIVMLFVVGLFATSAVAEAWWDIAPPTRPIPAPARASFAHSGLLVFEVKEAGIVEIAIGTKPAPGRGNRNSPFGPQPR